MDLKVRAESFYAGRSSQYNLPVEVGHFSINSDGKYTNDNHQMKYIAMPGQLTDLHMDLNEGYTDYIAISEDSENNSDKILKWILSNEEQVEKHFEDSSTNLKVDFVSFRGVLAKISYTLYERREDWKMHASKFRSVIYLRQLHTERQNRNDMDRREGGQRLSTYGFKFEQFMTSDTIESKPDTSVPVNENEKFYTVVKGKLDKFRILFSAEVDGVDPEHFKESGHDPNSMLRYVELKTSVLFTSFKQKRNFLRYKLIKWYLQSYLVATLRVICGFRDDAGTVRELGIYNVRDMPEMAEGQWSPSACLNFCSEFLNYVKQCVVKDDPNVVYEFYWTPGSNVTCKELPTDEERFLPHWYTERVKVI